MEFQQQLHLILSCLRNGSRTARDIGNSIGLEMNRVYPRLETYRLYGYVFKRRHTPSKKRFIWKLTEVGKKKLEFLDLKFAPEKTAMIDLTVPPYNFYDKVIIKDRNGEKSIIELIPEKIK